MSQQKLNDKQQDYVDTNAIALAVGLAAQGGVSYADIPAKSFDLAEAMLLEREKRYGEVEHGY